MSNETFYKDDRLPFAEIRHTQNSGRHYKPHIHNTFSVGAIDNGGVVYDIAGVKNKLSVGALAVINPDTIHHCNPAESVERSYYMLYIDIHWCAQLQQTTFGNNEFIPAQSTIINDNELYLDYIDTLQYFQSDDFSIEKEQRLFTLVDAIFKRVITKPASRSNDYKTELIELLKHKLSVQLERDVTINALANELNENPFTLLRRFKQHVGITPHAYRINYRIAQAKQLLQTNVSIADVGLQCGFFDQSHFHKHFKAQTTVTPKEYQLNFVQ